MCCTGLCWLRYDCLEQSCRLSLTCAILSAQLLAWGWNARGTLGHGHRTTERKPRHVSELRGVRIVQVEFY